MGKKTSVAAAAVFLIAGVAAAVPPPTPDEIVEGHTTFATLLISKRTDQTARYAAAVAVLIRELQTQHAAFSPGVLWFNDQYLLAPAQLSHRTEARYPCTGSVIAVPAGSPDPRPFFNQTSDQRDLLDFNPLSYIESYLITDPADHSWIVDHWSYHTGFPEEEEHLAWTVALLNDRLAGSEEDDGRSCPTFHTTTCTHPFFFSDDRDCLDRTCDDPFLLDRRECMIESATSGELLYNALLFIPLDNLLATGTKNHAPGSVDYTNDVSGCQVQTSAWPCPNGDDDREGNSHPFNPGFFLSDDSEGNSAGDRLDAEGRAGILNETYGAGGSGGGWASRSGTSAAASALQLRSVHGGSANCDTHLDHDLSCHATVLLDLYYGVASSPVVRNWREEFVDVVGSAAPYMCEQERGCTELEG